MTQKACAARAAVDARKAAAKRAMLQRIVRRAIELTLAEVDPELLRALRAAEAWSPSPARSAETEAFSGSRRAPLPHRVPTPVPYPREDGRR